MTWGRDTDADDAAAQLKTFRDAGGTLLDTADVYADGEAESVIGALVGRLVPRDGDALSCGTCSSDRSAEAGSRSPGSPWER